MKMLSDVFVNSMWLGKIRRPSLLAAISVLSPEVQIAIHMKFWEKKSDDAIARRLRMPKRLVDRLLSSGLQRLREDLERNRSLLLGIAA